MVQICNIISALSRAKTGFWGCANSQIQLIKQLTPLGVRTLGHPALHALPFEISTSVQSRELLELPRAVAHAIRHQSRTGQLLMIAFLVRVPIMTKLPTHSVPSLQDGDNLCLKLSVFSS